MGASTSQSLPYVLVALCFIAIIAWNTRQRCRGIDTDNVDTFFGGIIYFLFIGLRHEVGYDWEAYDAFFHDCHTDFDSFVARLENSNAEPLFQYYMFFVKNSVWDNLSFFMTLSTLIDLVVICWLFRRYSSFFMLSMLIYFALFLDLSLIHI